MPIFIFPTDKSMETLLSCHSHNSSYPIETEDAIISPPLPIDAICEIEIW